MGKIIRKLLSFTLIVSMVMSMCITALAAETPKITPNVNNFSSDVSLPVGENVNDILNKVIDDSFSSDGKISLNSAGLAWGPVKVGNLELKITNPHNGYVPGMGNVNHINFHITKTSNGRDIANYHIVKYSSGSNSCLYVYESVSKKVVIDKCYKNWTSAVGDVVAAAKNVVQAALSEADWLATIAILGVIIVVIADLIIPMDPVPIIPFSTDPTLVEY